LKTSRLAMESDKKQSILRRHGAIDNTVGKSLLEFFVLRTYLPLQVQLHHGDVPLRVVQPPRTQIETATDGLVV
jgi:hypothetical protein